MAGIGDTTRENMVIQTLLTNYESIMSSPVKREQRSQVKVQRRHVARATSNAGLAVRLFVKYDADGSNSLEFYEFKQLCYDLGRVAEESDFQAAFKGKESVSLEEFNLWLDESGYGGTGTLAHSQHLVTHVSIPCMTITLTAANIVLQQESTQRIS